MVEPVRIRGHHIYGVLQYFFRKELPSGRDLFKVLRTRGYSGVYINNKAKICEHFYDNPDAEILIVNDLDDLCKVPCGKRKPGWCENMHFIDTEAAREFGFIIGEKYLAKDFLNYVRKNW